MSSTIVAESEVGKDGWWAVAADVAGHRKVRPPSDADEHRRNVGSDVSRVHRTHVRFRLTIGRESFTVKQSSMTAPEPTLLFGCLTLMRNFILPTLSTFSLNVHLFFTCFLSSNRKLPRTPPNDRDKTSAGTNFGSNRAFYKVCFHKNFQALLSFPEHCVIASQKHIYAYFHHELFSNIGANPSQWGPFEYQIG